MSKTIIYTCDICKLEFSKQIVTGRFQGKYEAVRYSLTTDWTCYQTCSEKCYLDLLKRLSNV